MGDPRELLKYYSNLSLPQTNKIVNGDQKSDLIQSKVKKEHIYA